MALLVVGATLAASCSLDSTNPQPTGSGGGTTTSASTTTGATTGSEGTGGAPPLCKPGVTMECYSGPPGTDAHAPCAKGMQACPADGSGFGPCVGEVVPTAEDCASGVDSDCDGAVHACTGDVEWASQYGDHDSDAGRAVAVDSMGNVIVVGSFQDTVVLGATTLTSADIWPDILVAKLDPSGTVLWAFGFGGNGTDQGLSVAVDSDDNVVLAGFCEQTVKFSAIQTITCGGGKDPFVAKLDKNGVVAWAKAFNGSQDGFAEAVAVDGNGDVLVGGRFRGTLDVGAPVPPFNAGAEDGFVVKLSTQGAHVWSKQIADGGGQDQDIGAVAFDGLGNAFAAGRARGNVDFGGGAVTNHGGYDVVLAKYDPAGKLVWGNLYGDFTDGQTGTALRADQDGNVYVAGRLTGSLQFEQGPILAAYGTADAFVAKLDGAGVAQWAQHFGGFPTDTVAESVAFDPFGNVLLCGTTLAGTLPFGGTADPLPNKGGFDGWIAKLDPTGKAIWASTLGGPNNDRCWGVAASGAKAIVTGEFENTVTLGASMLTSAGAIDLFVASLAP